MTKNWKKCPVEKLIWLKCPYYLKCFYMITIVIKCLTTLFLKMKKKSKIHIDTKNFEWWEFWARRTKLETSHFWFQKYVTTRIKTVGARIKTKIYTRDRPKTQR